MGRVLESPQQVVTYFYSKMAKDDILALLDAGEIEPSTPTIKWLNNNSSWEDKISHSGQLEVCLKGRGFAFQSFIKSKTNGKETIVVYGITRAETKWIKTEGGSGYLTKFQRSASSRYYTSTLSVLIASAPQLPLEVQTMIKQYVEHEKKFSISPDLAVIGRLEMAEQLRLLEKKFGAKFSPEARDKVFSIINKVANYTSEPIAEVSSDFADYIEAQILGSKHALKYTQHKNLFKDFMSLAEKGVMWVTAPEAKAASMAKTIARNKTVQLRKPITDVKKGIRTVKKPVTKTKSVTKDINKIRGKK